MPKILLLANEFITINGVRVEFIKKLQENSYEVYLSLPEDERNRLFTEIGCHVDVIDINRWSINPIEEFKLFRAYQKQIKIINPDIVLAYTVKPNIYGGFACQTLHVPYINNVTGLGSIIQSDSLLKYLIFFLQKLAFSKSSCVFFQNKDNQNFFVTRNIVKSHHRLLPGSGVNLDQHPYEPYPFVNEKIKFLTISRLRKDKGYDELFEAIKKISSERNDIEFHIVGWVEDETYNQKINEMTSNYPVIFHGFQPKEAIHSYIKKCHCLIHPSHHEGMANAILEASASGRPCLASDIPGCKEAVKDGKTGYLFNVKDSKSLINTIKKFIALSYQEKVLMGINARNIMEIEFDRKFVVDAYMTEIEKSINANKRKVK